MICTTTFHAIAEEAPGLAAQLKGRDVQHVARWPSEAVAAAVDTCIWCEEAAGCATAAALPDPCPNASLIRTLDGETGRAA